MTEAVTYEGCLTVSRFDHRLEYCYTEEDIQQSMHSLKDTAADRFTLFGGYGMWAEFARWMDEMLNMELPPWVNAIVVGLDWEKGGVLTFTGIHQDYICGAIQEIEETADEDAGTVETAESGESPQDEAYLPQAPLLVWAKGMGIRDRTELLANALKWYVDCGRFAEKTGNRNIRILV